MTFHILSIFLFTQLLRSADESLRCGENDDSVGRSDKQDVNALLGYASHPCLAKIFICKKFQRTRNKSTFSISPFDIKMNCNS